MEDKDDVMSLTPTIDELTREIKSLKRKLALAESNMNRARLVSAAQNRVETILDASLKKEIQFFKLVLENATSILLLFDFDGRFAYASQKFLTHANIANFGLIEGRYYAEVLEPMVTAENLKKFNDALELAILEKRTVNIEDQIDIHYQGAPRMFSIMITPMIDEVGNSTGIMALFNDITGLNNSLEAANRANAAKTEFLANMSHEIRTPLNAIVGMSTVALGSEEIDKIHYCLDKINESSAHLLGIINDILDMSKIESNHFELFFTEFVFEKMLLRVVDMMRFKIEEKDIEFIMHCDPMIPYAIYSDEQRIAQVIMNLFSNAVKFTPKGGKIEIKAVIEEINGDDCVIRISVIDNGIGITEEQKPRLFKVFSQADSSISRKFGGTGLGLAISKNIIEMLNGHIWFESNSGEGTKFEFNFHTKACSLSPKLKINKYDIKMLAIDDVPEILASFAVYSQKIGVSCLTAESGEQALKILETYKPNIIFVDWKMPGMDGVSLVEQIQAKNKDHMVIIMISAADWSDIEKEAKNLGVNEFVSKPLLLPIIEHILDKYCQDETQKEVEEVVDFSKKKIMLVDDIEINREIIISLLEETGINIVSAENGKRAVEEFERAKEPFDLIFMDVQMPEMDGYEATRIIREIEGNTLFPVPIVAMTANVFKEDIEKCLNAKMNDHIGKPINIDEVYAKIKKWTSKTNIT